MALVKNFGIAGVSADIQFGKGGGHIKNSGPGTLFQLYQSDDATLSNIQFGTVQDGTWQGTAVAANYGGTGLTTYNKGDILYAGSTDPTALTALPIGTAGYVLTVNSVTGVPYWESSGSAVNSYSSITAGGTTTDASGASNITFNTGLGTTTSVSPSGSSATATLEVDTSINSGSVLKNNVGVGSTQLGIQSGTSGNALISAGASAEAQFGLLNIGTANANVTGALTVTNGGTGLSSITTNGVLYGNGTNNVNVTPAGTNGYVLNSASGVPTWTNEFAIDFGFQPGTVSAPGLFVATNVATGIFQATSNTLSVSAGGTEAVRFLQNVGATNYLTVTPGVTGTSDVTISNAGTATDDGGLGLILQAASATAAPNNGNGGQVYLNGGNGFDAGAGGATTMIGGNGGATGVGGAAIITAGNGGSTSGNGGAVNITSGKGTTQGNGGNVNITAGEATAATGGQNGGNVILMAGIGAGTGTDGVTEIVDAHGHLNTTFTDADPASSIALGSTSTGIYINAVNGTGTNQNVSISPTGTGQILAPIGYTPTTAESLITMGYADGLYAFGVVDTQSGTATATSVTDTLTIDGALGITTSATGKTVTVETSIASGSVLVNNAGGGNKLDIISGTAGNALISGGASQAEFGLLNLSVANANVTGALTVTNGGTGVATIASNGVVYGNSSSPTGPVGVTAAGTQYQVLNAGASGVPVFDAVHLNQSAAVTGNLPLTNGGTNASLTAVAGAPIYSTSSAFAVGTAGMTGQAYISGGASAPTWQTVSSDINANPGAILEGNGSGAFTATGATFVGSPTYSGVTLSGTPTNATDAVTVAYVSALVSALNVHPACDVMANETSSGTQMTTATYINGTIDKNGGYGIGATLTANASMLGAVAVGTKWGIPGKFTTGTSFTGTITQTGTLATATFVSVYPTTEPSPSVVYSQILTVSGLTGSPNATGTWTQGGNVFTPTDVPQDLIPGETITQSPSGATAVVAIVANGTYTMSTSLSVNTVTGTPNATQPWVGSTSGATFTPTTVPSYTALNVDSHVVMVDERVLVNISNSGLGAVYNGMYYESTLGVTGAAGGSGVAWVLTRAVDENDSIQNQFTPGDFTFIAEGTDYHGTGWAETLLGSGTPTYPVSGNSDDSIIIGTDNALFTQFSGTGTYTNGAGLSLTGTTFSVNTDGTTTYIDGSNNVAVKSSATADQVLLSDGASTTPTWGALPLNNTNSVTGTLAVGNGGTGDTTFTQYGVVYGNGTSPLGVTAAGTLGYLLTSNATSAPTYQQLNLGTSPAITGTLSVANGGTGDSSLTLNGVVFGNGTSPAGVTAAGTQYQVLQAGSGGVPTFGAISLNQSAAVTGSLGATNGGTGQSTVAQGDLLVGGATANTWTELTLGASGYILTSNGTTAVWSSVSSAVPAYSTVADTHGDTNTATGAGTITFDDGTGTTAMTSNGGGNAATVTVNFNPASLPDNPTGLTDYLVLNSHGGTPEIRGVLDFLHDNNIAYTTDLGIIVQTSADVWGSVTIVDATNGGISVTNGNGTAGNPTLAVNVNDLTTDGSAATSSYTFAAYNGSSTVQVPINVIANYVADDEDAFSSLTTVTANGSTSSFNLGAVLPANAYVTCVRIDVGTVFSVDFTDITDGAGAHTLVANSDADFTTAGNYLVELVGTINSGGDQVTLVFPSAPATGSATIRVEWEINS
jgi:hypothetical protein